MSKTGIDWPGLTHTWSPIVGCKHNCSACIAETWNKIYKWVPDFKDPQIFENRMEWPYNHKKPCSVFVVFLGDLFGNWVDTKFIRRVIRVCWDNPQHTFWFLTKNPRRYQYYQYPKNCKLGCSITGQESAWDQRKNMEYLLDASIENDAVPELFISFEPLLGKVTANIPESIDQVIIGAQTSPNVAPKKEWIKSIRHPNIHYKKNILKYL